jgi:hypothetical protein
VAIGLIVPLTAWGPVADANAADPGALTGLDTSAANRRAAIDGVYDWSGAGYRGGEDLPRTEALAPSSSCDITAAELAGDYGVFPNDGVDDTAGIQAAIDVIRDTCSPNADYENLSRITLPAGQLDVSQEIHVDADYLVVRGAGSDESTGTLLVYRPDENTRYDTITADGSEWDKDAMSYGSGSGGWLWPGRGLFRVQSRGVHTSYASDYASAPENRADLFEGTVNVHWKTGLALRAKDGDPGYSARAGDTVVHLASKGSMTNFTVGTLVNIRVANSMDFYAEQEALPTDHALQNLHMRQQIFRITAVDTSNRTITLDKPLEYDVTVDSTSDGSAAIDGSAYASKAAAIVDPVVGVGIEDLAFTQVVDGLTPADAVHEYGNLAPAEAMHGIVFKWAADSWVRGIRTEMTGSHPIVTEEAKNLQIVDNVLDGAWNKGKGGNGYFRGSRVWDSLYAGNTTRNLRHFTFQWAASGNVVIGNDFDSDLNLHGGWERNNLFELNHVAVPYDHRSGSCTVNCGEEGGGGPDGSTWYPIWWGAGQKAIKWSGSTGPHNVFFNNDLSKEMSDGSYAPYYSEPGQLYRFGWNGTEWTHLNVDGTSISDWAHHETGDYSNGGGVDVSLTDNGESLFLIDPDRRVSDAPVDPVEPTTPVVDPTDAPTDTPSSEPTTEPTDTPTSGPTAGPTADPTADPTSGPTGPTPTREPTTTPTTSAPTAGPTNPGTTQPTTSAPVASSGLIAEFTVDSPWSDGYGGEIVVTNTTDATIEGWTVRITLPEGTTVSKSWRSTYVRDGQDFIFSPMSYTSTIKKGDSEDFGFNVDGPGLPTACTIDGYPCVGFTSGGGGTPSEEPTSDPEPTTVPTSGPTIPAPEPTAEPSEDPEPTIEPTVEPTIPVTPPADADVYVTTAAELSTALAAAQPGQVIALASGTYEGSFVATTAGTITEPITLIGPADAIITNDGPLGTSPSCPTPTAGWDSGYGLWLHGASHWRLQGFTVADAKKGIVLDSSTHVSIVGVTVRDIEEEGIHFRASSSDGVVRDSTITRTGLVKPGYGEAIYLGSSNSNFDCYGTVDGVDRSDRIQVIGNTIGPDIGGEHIDIKEGTADGIIRDNTFIGGVSGANSATSWIDAKGNDYLIEGNVGRHDGSGVLEHGYETHNLLTGYGCGNVWKSNETDLGGVDGYAINVTSTSKCSGHLNVVHASNTATNAGKGLTNINVTP